MAKKPSGLGRGLGDLLEDNMPHVSNSHRVVLKKEEPVTVSPQIEVGAVTLQGDAGRSAAELGSERQAKPLFDQPIRNRSVKANFKNQK